MPTAFLLVTTLLTTVAAHVQAHGHMTQPPSRYAVGRDNDDHQRQPLQLRANSFPPGWTTPLTPCGGVLKSQSNVGVTSVQAGSDLLVGWEMGYWTGAALHQGTVTVSMQPADPQDAGDWRELGSISLVGLSSVATTPHNMTVGLPADLVDREIYTLQWHWVGSVTPEIYYNCADLVVHGVNANQQSLPPAKTPVQQIQQPVSKSGTVYTGRMTYYDTSVGLGSCGHQNQNTELVVAINWQQYSTALCFSYICITYGGQSVTAQIVDQCGGCGVGGLDATPALFTKFQPESVGVFEMSWTFGACGETAVPLLTANKEAVAPTTSQPPSNTQAPATTQQPSPPAGLTQPQQTSSPIINKPTTNNNTPLTTPSGPCSPGKFACNSSGGISVCDGTGIWVSVASLGSCQGNDSMCVGDNFVSCVGGVWRCMSCTFGTSCETSGANVSCAWPAAVRRKRDDEL